MPGTQLGGKDGCVHITKALFTILQSLVSPCGYWSLSEARITPWLKCEETEGSAISQLCDLGQGTVPLEASVSPLSNDRIKLNHYLFHERQSETI